MCDLYPFARLMASDRAKLPKDIYPFRNYIRGPQQVALQRLGNLLRVMASNRILIFSGTPFEGLECDPVFYSTRAKHAF